MIKELSFILCSSLLFAASSEAIVLFSWEESGNDVTVTLSGEFNVAGWTTTNETVLDPGASFFNFQFESEFEWENMPPYQGLQVRALSTSGQLTSSSFDAGTLLLSPWGTPTGADLWGTFESGTFAGRISLFTSGVSAFLQTSSIEDGVFAVDAVYRFAGTTLVDMFGDGLNAWSSGAHIADIESNEIWFTVIPEPSTYVAIFGGVGLLFALAKRRARSAG